MNHKRNIFLLVILCLSCFFVNLGLFDPDLMEARNFITAREMIQNDTWLIPTMNGELRLEKQPFVTWLTALSAKAGNSITNLFIMRLPSAIIATLMVLFFYGLCYELNRQKSFALIGGAVFATSMLVVEMSMVNSWDIFTHAFMVGSIWMQVKALNKPGNNNLMWLLATLLMGLSVFSKGPVSFYALWLPFFISYYIFYDRYRIHKNLWKLLLMLVVAFLIGFAWNIYLYLVIPEKLTEVLIKEASARGSRHVRPFYFYFHFAAYIGIWTIPLLAALFFKKMRQKINSISKYRFLLAWMLIGLVLLSIIPEKKERYMLPLEVPMSLMVAYLLYSVYLAFKKGFAAAPERSLLQIHGWTVCLVLTALPVVAFVVMGNDFYSFKYIAGGVVSLIAVFVLSRALIRLTGTTGFKIIFASTLLTVVLVASVYLPVLAKVTYNNEFRDPAIISTMIELNNVPFISAGELNMELIWRIGRPVKPVDLAKFDIAEKKEVVLFCYDSLDKFLTPNQLDKIQVIMSDTFDCNKDKSNCKLYVYHLKSKG